MAKVAIVGAGSIVFCQTLILDILGTPGLQDTEFALMAPRNPHLADRDLRQSGHQRESASREGLDHHRPPRRVAGG